MITDNLFNVAISQLLQYGKAELAKMFPRDFEVYMCALELVDEHNDTVDYFAFPIMPKSIRKTESEVTSFQHSFSGITVFNKQGFIPDELNIEGDFGRSFKITGNSAQKEDDFAYVVPSEGSATLVKAFSINDGYYTSEDINARQSQKQREFPYGIKTGFGCTKILQSIISKAKAFGDTGRTFKLFFYNPALGENYLVIPSKNPLMFSQNEQNSNMIWQYSLNLIIIADAKDVLDYKSNKKNMSYAFGADQLLGGITTSKSMAMSYGNMITTTR